MLHDTQRGTGMGMGKLAAYSRLVGLVPAERGTNRMHRQPHEVQSASRPGCGPGIRYWLVFLYADLPPVGRRLRWLSHAVITWVQDYVRPRISATRRLLGFSATPTCAADRDCHCVWALRARCCRGAITCSMTIGDRQLSPAVRLMSRTMLPVRCGVSSCRAAPPDPAPSFWMIKLLTGTI